MRSDERAAVQALLDAVTVAGVAAGTEATVRAWLDVRAAHQRVAGLLAVPVEELAQRVHNDEPPLYFLEIKGDPPLPEHVEDGMDPDGWECPGCGCTAESLEDALPMLHWAIGEGKPRRIVYEDHVFTVVREVPADYPVD